MAFIGTSFSSSRSWILDRASERPKSKPFTRGSFHGARLGGLAAPADSRFSLSGNEAVYEAHLPASFVAVDPHGNFSFGRWMSDGILEDEKVGSELSNRQDVAVDAQLDANIGGVT